MRVLISDDSVSLPASIEEMFRGALVAPSAEWLAPGVAAALLACNGTQPAGAINPGSQSKNDCGPRAPLPPCAPCDLRDQPELLATILDALGIALLNRGCLTQGATLVRAALQIRLKYLGKNHPATAASYTSNARVLRMEDELLAAEKEVVRALKILGRRDLATASSLNELGAIQLYQGDFRAAQRSALRGLLIVKRHRVAKTDPNVSRLLDVLGRAYEGQGKLALAYKTLNSAVQLDEQQVGTEHPRYATHRANLAVVQWAQGDLPAAKTGFESTIVVYEKVLGRTGHPNLIDMYANLGSVLVKLGDYANAKSYICKALGLNEQLRGAGHTLVGNDHANLGRLYFASGDKTAARAEFGAALDIYKDNVKRKRLPKNHPYIKEVRIWIERSEC